MFWKRFEVQIQEMKEYVIHFVSVHIDAKFELLNSYTKKNYIEGP